MREQGGAKAPLGGLEEHRRAQFQVFAYHLGRVTDGRTENARRASFGFRHLPGDLEETCRAILSDQLHVLVFLNIGMDPRMTQLGALRLAPAPCATWGHPPTSALPTLAYLSPRHPTNPQHPQTTS